MPEPQPRGSAHGLAAYLTGGHRLVLKVEDVPFVAAKDVYCYNNLLRQNVGRNASRKMGESQTGTLEARERESVMTGMCKGTMCLPGGVNTWTRECRREHSWGHNSYPQMKTQA